MARDGLIDEAKTVRGATPLQHQHRALVFLVALAVSFVLEHAALAAATPAETKTIETHLYALQATTMRVPRSPASFGGAITALHNDLLLATAHGSLHLVGHRRGEVVAIDGQVPMGLADLLRAQDGGQKVRKEYFRVTDILLKRLARARYQLFATHLYFTGSCIRFRLSSTTVGLGFPDSSVRTVIGMSVSPSWKTIFDADPCLATDWPWLLESGGRMLADGLGPVSTAGGGGVNTCW